MIVGRSQSNSTGESTAPLRVGIAGLGRSGWLIHALTLDEFPDAYQVTAVADTSGERNEEARAKFGCETFDSVEDMIDRGTMDVLIVATPSHLHAPHTIRALESGRHVVVEKPFAMSSDEAHRMIEVAASAGRVIAPFQNRRFESHFLKVKELADSGLFGEVLQIRMAWHTFSRRWDWQALKRFGGGALTNNGAHLLDQAMVLFGEGEPEIFLDLKPGLTLGDAEQHMKLVLHGPGHPTIDIELTNASAFPQERWSLMGTNGGLRGSTTELEWRTVDWSSMPDRTLETGAAPGREYNQEAVEWVHGSWTDSDDRREPYRRFFANLHGAITNGEPLFVTPSSALRCMSVLDRCRAEMALSRP